jgi:hypothetical protein
MGGAHILVAHARGVVLEVAQGRVGKKARSPRSIRRLRACWAVQAPVGWAVTPRMCTARA